MKRLGLLLDNLAVIRSTLNNDDFDPVQFGVLAETAGVQSLVCTFTGGKKGITNRDLQVLKEIRKSFLNVRISIKEDDLRKVLSLTPDMVTFVDAKPNDPFSISAVDTTVFADTLEQMLPDLQANNISASVLVKPEINILKSINKLQLDYVELEISDYTTADNINDELVQLDKIKSATIAAGKLGLGVNCCGNIKFEHISALAQIQNLEDIIIGTNLIKRSMWVGVDRAVGEALQQLRHRDLE